MPRKLMFEAVDIARRSNEEFVKNFLKDFFPNFRTETLEKMQESVRFTISGMIRALHSSRQFSSLLDQMKKIFFTTEDCINFYETKFDLQEIPPLPVPPQVFCVTIINNILIWIFIV